MAASQTESAAAEDFEGTVNPFAAPSPPAVNGRMTSIEGPNDSASPSHTLDEPVLTTVKRDVLMVGRKLKMVLLPRAGASDGQTSAMFALVFVLVWAGSAIVTVNAQLLGAQVSFFQSVCVLGYCIFPLVIAALVNKLLPFAVTKMIVVVAAFLWATRASIVFMQGLVPEERRALAAYPVLLFYVAISWMVFVT